MRLIILKSTHYPTNKKLRLESIKLQSGYEPDLSPQTKNPTNHWSHKDNLNILVFCLNFVKVYKVLFHRSFGKSG